MSTLVKLSLSSGGSATLSSFGHDPLRQGLVELTLIEGVDVPDDAAWARVLRALGRSAPSTSLARLTRPVCSQ
jgi:hypothetical protein